MLGLKLNHVSKSGHSDWDAMTLTLNITTEYHHPRGKTIISVIQETHRFQLKLKAQASTH